MLGARYLARNPLGIVALFISLIYGFATLLLGISASALQPSERVPLVWFVVLFPILVLVCFYILVTRHHGKLYAPDDYRDDQSFLQTLSPLQQAARLDEEIEASQAIDQEDEETDTTGRTPRDPERADRAAEHRQRRAEYQLAERLAIRKLSKETGLAFKEQVTFGEGRMGAFDAVAVEDNGYLAVEVKFARGPNPHIFMLRDILYRGVLAANLVSQQRDLTGHQKGLRLMLAFVLDGEAMARRDSLERMVRRQLEDAPFPVDCRFYALAELKRESGVTDA